MVIAFPWVGAPARVWRTLTFPLSSSPVGSMRRTFQHRSTRWQNWHILFRWNVHSRIMRSSFCVHAQALYEFRSILWQLFEFRKFRLALTKSRSRSFQFLGAILEVISAVHLTRKHTLLST